MRVLYINDDPEWLRTMPNILKGLEVISTRGALDAIRIAETTSFDLLLTDKNLGDTHRGCVPLLDFMERERPQVPVIMISAEDGEQAKKELYCHDYIEIGEEEWIHKLRQAVKRHNLTG